MNVAPECSSNGGLFISLLLHGVYCNGLIDSGVDVSLVSSSFMEYISQQVSVKLEATSETICVLGGGTVKVDAKCRIPVKIGSVIVTHEFWVVPMGTNCLLGGDFLRAQECIVNYKEMTLTVATEKVTMKVKDGEDVHQVLRVVLEQSVKLKPYSEMFVFAKVVGAESAAGLQMIGPVDDFCETGGVLVGKTLAKPCNGVVPVRLVNISPGKKKLRRKTEVAKCEPVECV